MGYTIANTKESQALELFERASTDCLYATASVGTTALLYNVGVGTSSGGAVGLQALTETVGGALESVGAVAGSSLAEGGATAVGMAIAGAIGFDIGVDLGSIFYGLDDAETTNALIHFFGDNIWAKENILPILVRDNVTYVDKDVIESFVQYLEDNDVLSSDTATYNSDYNVEGGNYVTCQQSSLSYQIDPLLLASSMHSLNENDIRGFAYLASSTPINMTVGDYYIMSTPYFGYSDLGSYAIGRIRGVESLEVCYRDIEYNSFRYPYTTHNGSKFLKLHGDHLVWEILEWKFTQGYLEQGSFVESHGTFEDGHEFVVGNPASNPFFDIGFANSPSSHDIICDNLGLVYVPPVPLAKRQKGAEQPKSKATMWNTTTGSAWLSRGITITKTHPVTGVKTQSVALPLSIPNVTDRDKAVAIPFPVAQDLAIEGTIDDTKPLDITIPRILEIARAQAIDIPADPPVEDKTPTLPVVLPSLQSETGMTEIYTPTASQLKSFSQFLWSTNFFDVVTKIIQDPMDAIVTLHKIYCPVTLDGTADIVIGAVSSGVQSNYTRHQYVDLDCGSYTLQEYFHDYRDYDGYTSVQVFLPFIGFRTLRTNDVMGGSIAIKYKIDLMTGNCVAFIDITKNTVTQRLYTFNGNCAEEIPYNGAQYSQVASNGVALIGSVISAVATGGATAPLVVGSAMSTATSLGNTVERGGSITSNFGALGNKKPYLVINRPKPNTALGFEVTQGLPNNKNVALSSLTGYTRIKSVNLSGITCTEEERNMILAQLKEGVLL